MTDNITPRAPTRGSCKTGTSTPINVRRQMP